MLELSLREMSWMDKAACKAADPKLFFPVSHQDDNPQSKKGTYKQARLICKDCPVNEECLDYALRMFPKADDDFGMWGGMSPLERRRIKRRRYFPYNG